MARGGPKAKRNRKRRARQRRTQANREAGANAHWEELDALRKRLEPPNESAADHLVSLREELDSWLAPYDAYDLIASLALGAYLDRESVSGRHLKLDSYVVEYGAVNVLRRLQRMPEAPRPEGPDWDGDIQKLDFLLNRTLMVSRDVEGKEMPGLDSLSDAQRHAQYRYMSMQLFAHDPVPPDRELDRLMLLFEPFEETLYEQLGFTAIMAGAICASISVQTGQGLAAFFSLPQGLDPLEVRTALQKRADNRDPALPGLVVHEGLGRAIAFKTSDLSEMIGFPEEIVQSLLQRLTIGFGDIRDGDPWGQIRRFRQTPVVEDGSGALLAPVPYDVLYVVRGMLEDALRDAGLLEQFQRRRANYLEDATRGVFANSLNPDRCLRSLSYEHPDDGEVKLPEGDGLILLDKIALVCEAKAGGLSPAARGGEPKALAKAFNRILFEAIDQAERTRGALAGGRTVKGVDENTETIEVSPLELAQVVPVAVTLEDLSGPSAMLWELMDREPSGVDPADWPWIVNIDDLLWFADELPLGSELVHYIFVRQRLASAGKVSIGNEADWFRFYRNQGAARAIEIVEGAQQLGNFDSHTLIVSDARRGRPDPSLPPIDLAVSPLLQRLDEQRPSGWLAASLALLDLHPDQGTKILKDLPRRLKRAEKGFIGTATVRPVADPNVALTIRIGSLGTGAHKREGQLVEGGAKRRIVVAVDGTLDDLVLRCDVEQPPLGS